MDEEIEQNFMSPIKVKSAVQIVVDRLTQAIISGQLKAGDRVALNVQELSGDIINVINIGEKK